MAGPEEDFLSRWSRRKRADRAGAPEEALPSSAAPVPPVPVDTAPAPTAPLPPVDSLTPESDFSPFMKDEVDSVMRRDALKKLFEDPRFNVMDGMDVYVDDYSVPDPLPEGWLEKLNQVAGLGDVPARERAEREARERAEADRERAIGERDAAEAAEAARPREAPVPVRNPPADDSGQIETGPLPAP